MRDQKTLSCLSLPVGVVGSIHRSSGNSFSRKFCWDSQIRNDLALPRKLIEKYMLQTGKILVIEEVDAFLEGNLKELAADMVTGTPLDLLW